MIIEKFPLTVGRNCLLASVKDVLQFYNVTVKESDLYFICGGLRFTFCPDSKKEKVSDCFVYDVGKYISKYISSFFNCRFSFETSAAQARIKRLLDKHIPVILLIHPKYISYNHRVFQPEGAQEMHSIVLYGYDDFTDTYYVADSTATDDNGVFAARRECMRCDIVREYAFGFFHFADKPLQEKDWQLVYRCVGDNLYDFINSKSTEGGLYTGAQAIYKMLDYIDVNEACPLSELKFIMQAYFMPLFLYLIDFLEGAKGLKEYVYILKTEKNKWDILYYKYLLKQSAFWSKNKMIKVIRQYFKTLLECLAEIQNAISIYDSNKIY